MFMEDDTVPRDCGQQLGQLTAREQVKASLETGLDNMATSINILEGMCFHVPLFPISKWAVALLFLSTAN